MTRWLSVAYLPSNRAQSASGRRVAQYWTTPSNRKCLRPDSRSGNRAARAEIGSVAAVKDNVRDVTWETRVDTFAQDVRFAVRSFLRAPRFTIPALLALALGIGATSAIFSVVRGVMLEPLPYHEPDRIVAVWETLRNVNRSVISPASFLVWRERNRSFEHLGMVEPRRFAMMINGQADEIEGLAFSSGVFGALGVQPALGRGYTAQEDLEGNDAVIVLSHEFWQTRLGGRAEWRSPSMPQPHVSVSRPVHRRRQKAAYLIRIAVP